MAFRLTGATTPNWSISTTAGDSVPGSAYQLVSNPLVRDDLLLSGAGRVEVTNLGRWAWAHSRKGTKAGGQLFREGLLRHLESWRKSWLMTVFLAGEKCFDSTKEKFHRERKARIFRGWLCGFRTYFQYIYISISPPATFVTFGNLFQASEMQKRLQEMQGALLTETCHLWLQSFTSTNSAEHVELWKMPLRNVGNCKKQKLSFTEQGNRSLPWGSQLWL